MLKLKSVHKLVCGLGKTRFKPKPLVSVRRNHTQSLLRNYKWSTANLSKYNTVMFDCDGVLYSGRDAFEGAKETLHALQAMGKRLLFVTNSSSKPDAKCIRILNGHFGIDVDPSQVWTSATATVAYLKRLPEFADVYTYKVASDGTVEHISEKKKKRTVFLIGSEALYRKLRDAGFDVIWSKKMMYASSGRNPGDCELDSSVCAVVVGFDADYGWFDVSLACRYLHSHCSQKPVHFVATNGDDTYPAKPGVFLACTGSMLAAVSATTELKPVICGKPHSVLMDCIQQTFADVSADNTLMVGDILYTDIAFANNLQMDSLLVLSGVTHAKDAQRLIQETGATPTFVLESVAQIISDSSKVAPKL